MSLIGLILILAVIGLITWIVITYVPMPPPFKTVILVVVLLVVLLWLLQIFGVLGAANLRVGD